MSISSEMEELLEFAQDKLAQLKDKHEIEVQLSKQMADRFSKNIAAFEEYLPNVAKEFRNYRPDSIDVFCTSTGHANIMDKATGKALYSDDPITQCQEQVEKNIKDPKYTSLSFPRDMGATSTFIHLKYMNRMYKEVLDAQDEHAPLTHIPEQLGSMVVFGVGLGYHIEYMLEKIEINHLYICEPNLNWFFSSLYTCDWAKVLKLIDERSDYVYFNIGVGYQQITTDFMNEMINRGSFHCVKSVIYQHYPSEDLTKLIEEMNSNFHMFSTGWGFFDDGIISIAHDYTNLKNGVPTLKHTCVVPKQWDDLPVFIVANGPSLDIAIDLIKESINDAIIISCGSAINALLSNNIIPDFHIALERTKFTSIWYETMVDPEILKQINLLTVNVMHPDLPNMFKWAGLALKPAEPGTVLFNDYIHRGKDFAPLRFCNPQVANTALAMADAWGVKDIYLFGVDCGYKDREHHHSKSSAYYTKSGEEKAELGKLTRAGEIVVEGNFGGKVFSTTFMDAARMFLEKVCEFSNTSYVYNCSDGAKIGGAYPLTPDNVLIRQGRTDKQEYIEHIKANFFAPRIVGENEYENALAVDRFIEIVNAMIEYIDKPFTSRKEATEALIEQVRYLYSYANTYNRHVYFILNGTISYAHTIFRMALFGFEDDDVCMDVFNQTKDIFIDYLRETQKIFPNALSAIDENDGSHLIDIFDSASVK